MRNGRDADTHAARKGVRPRADYRAADLPTARTVRRDAPLARYEIHVAPSSLWIAISVVVFHFATPGVSRFASLSVDDVALVWLRNIVLMTACRHRRSTLVAAHPQGLGNRLK